VATALLNNLWSGPLAACQDKPRYRGHIDGDNHRGGTPGHIHTDETRVCVQAKSGVVLTEREDTYGRNTHTSTNTDKFKCCIIILLPGPIDNHIGDLLGERRGLYGTGEDVEANYNQGSREGGPLLDYWLGCRT
jgi:hypothetical protein